jgi:hypothetical protein
MSNYTTWIGRNEFPSLVQKKEEEPKEKVLPKNDLPEAKSHQKNDNLMRVWCSYHSEWKWLPVSQVDLDDYWIIENEQKDKRRGYRQGNHKGNRRGK